MSHTPATHRDAVDDFLAQRRIAVAGVSAKQPGVANGIYKKLRAAGYEVFAVNPSADEVEGDRCYPNLTSIPDGVDGVVIGTRPDTAETIVRQCAELGIRRVWMHRLVGRGSVSDAAARFCREQGIAVIAGACPMMYVPPVDIGHRCFRWMLAATGRLPPP
jgi:predicted CoA-binding protein